MQEQTGRTLERMEKSGRLCQRMASEGVWAEVFNNTITGSSWLKDQTFSPGRWALGYQALYVLYRTLDQVRPSSILELGLGQSTHMTTQYAQQQKDVSHLVVENDPNWIAFYERRNPLGDNTHILQMDLTFQPYRDVPAVRSYANFQQLKGKTFDLILIDAPLGGDMKQFARVDLLGLLPDCLAPSFVILMDDTNRPGEKHTVAEITEVLQPLGAVTATYSGAKDMTIWTSPDLSFLCTM